MLGLKDVLAQIFLFLFSEHFLHFGLKPVGDSYVFDYILISITDLPFWFDLGKDDDLRIIMYFMGGVWNIFFYIGIMEKRFIKGKGKENVCEVNATKLY